MRTWRSRNRVVFLLAAAVACAIVGRLSNAYPLRLALLPLGALVHEALMWRKANPTRVSWLEPAGLGAAGVAVGLKYWFVHAEGASIFQISTGLHQLSLTAICLFGVSFALFSDRSQIGQALCSAPLRYLGNMSYSYYLTHSLVIKVLSLFAAALVVVVRSALGFWLMVPAVFMLSLVPAAAMFLAVEKPASS